jgi:cytochrome c
VKGYKYSKAMKKADITWDDKTLDAYLTKPKKFLKGTKMTFVGLKKKKDRDNVIAYIKDKTK